MDIACRNSTFMERITMKYFLMIDYKKECKGEEEGKLHFFFVD